MLQGILAANVVGFHTFSHARHFLTACARYVGVGSQSQMGDLCINYEGRNVMVCTNHVGLEAGMISRDEVTICAFKSQSACKKNMWDGHFCIV